LCHGIAEQESIAVISITSTYANTGQFLAPGSVSLRCVMSTA
jgi:hypothetical protein